MGWFYTNGGSRADLIRELIAPQSNDTGWSRKCLKHCAIGNVLWTVWEVTAAEDGSKMNVIGCDLLHRHPEGWGHKPMTEEDGPVYVTCPLSYLEMAPELDPQWRNRVRQYWAERKDLMRARRERKTR